MKLLITALAASAALGLAACESDGYYDGGGGFSAGYYGHGPRSVWYDGWYDNFYGPVYDGYWGPGDSFFYRTAPGGIYYRDGLNHFRRGRFDGGSQFRFRGSMH